jgi:hypothetical protein
VMPALASAELSLTARSIKFVVRLVGCCVDITLQRPHGRALNSAIARILQGPTTSWRCSSNR